MIDLIIPVLDRPHNAQPLVESIDAATLVPHQTLFVATRGDEAQIAACKATHCAVILIDERGYAAKVNRAIRHELCTSEFVFLGADDLRFHRDWDRAAVDRYYATECPVIGTNDLGNATVMSGKHATHSLVHRSYLEAGTIDDPTKLLHEGYEHNWVDTEFVQTAKAREAFTFAFDSHVEHMHPFWHKGEDDEVYRWARARYHKDSRLYRQRQKLWR